MDEVKSTKGNKKKKRNKKKDDIDVVKNVDKDKDKTTDALTDTAESTTSSACKMTATTEAPGDDSIKHFSSDEDQVTQVRKFLTLLSNSQ